MPRTHHKPSRPRLGIALSLAALGLGIACIAWAVANIGAKPVYTAVASPTVAPLPSAAPSSDASTLGVEPHPLKMSATSSPRVPSRPASKGGRIGTLTIPVLKRRIPIIEGTGDDELDRGVGHFVQSVLPGQSDNCVLSGHRDTVLTDLGRVHRGDELVVQTSTGRFTYEVRRIRIVDKDDRTVIVPTVHAVLTLSTCYPFHFVGSAPKRYVLVADLVAGK